MVLLHVTLALASLVAVLAFRHVVFPALVSDLRRLPNGHWSSPFTSMWVERRWFHNMDNNRRVTRLLQAHVASGPVVRVGPTDVSVSSLEGLRKVYILDLWKDDWYPTNNELGFHFGHLPMIRIRDREAHSQRKRYVAGAFSKSFVLSSSDLEASAKMYLYARVVPFLGAAASQCRPVNVLQFAQWSSADLVSAYLLGSHNRTDFLHEAADRELYFGKGGDWTQNKEGGAHFFMDKCRATIAMLGNEPEEATKPAVLRRLYEGMRSSKPPLSIEELTKACTSELLDQFLAGHELISITLAYAFWQLSKRPQLQSLLRQELATLDNSPPFGSRDENGKSSSLAELDSLPLTNAVLYETLRLYHPTPGEQPRTVKHPGIHIHGFFIPPETRISASIYTQHHDEEAYPDSFEWVPERWMPDSSGKIDPNVARHFWGFGSGSRMCIGVHLAVAVSNIILASVYASYATTIFSDDRMEQTEDVLALPKSNRLLLKFRRIE